MAESLLPGAGWGVLHLFWRVGADTDHDKVAAAVDSCVADKHQVVTVGILGHKADVGVMALGPDLWRLRVLQTELRRAGLELVDSYVSFTEVSEYAQNMPPEMLMTRLYPQLPPEGKRAFCFYPMSMRRGESHNWYALPFDERADLIEGHGRAGRTFSGRVVQLVTGSTGVDDFDLAVTLFAGDPVDLKEVVYATRFDEASARYAEFGPVVTGMVAPVDIVLTEVSP